MKIRIARMDELRDIISFYDMMCRELGQADFLPEGNKGGFPPESMVIQAIRNKELFVGIEDDQIIAAYIINHDADAAYDTVKWQVEADKKDVSVLHALRVAPAFSGKGYASKLVEHAIQTAGSRKQKAIRLDCIEGNFVPHKMYQSHGFRYIDTVQICYEDIGVPRKFLLFERVIPE